jgi:hypothetical protein
MLPSIINYQLSIIQVSLVALLDFKSLSYGKNFGVERNGRGVSSFAAGVKGTILFFIWRF